MVVVISVVVATRRGKCHWILSPDTEISAVEGKTIAGPENTLYRVYGMDFRLILTFHAFSKMCWI